MLGFKKSIESTILHIMVRVYNGAKAGLGQPERIEMEAKEKVNL